MTVAITPEDAASVRSVVLYIGPLQAASMAKAAGWYRITADEGGQLNYNGPFNTEREAGMSLWGQP